MSFALNGTHIEGGTFNNVCGSMSQVVHTHVTHIRSAPGRRVEDGSDDFLLAASTTTDRFIGAIRPPRASRHGNVGPYKDTMSLRDQRNYANDDRTSRKTPRAIQGSRSSLGILTDFELARGQMKPQREQNYSVAAQTSAMPPENISTTTFNSVGGDMIQLNVTSNGESALAVLYPHVVTEALHDSGERFPEPACHPGTRTTVMQQLRDWSLDTNPASTILWLHGSAGAGKSAIAQTFSGDGQNQGRLGASFFFRRGHSKRGSWHGLFKTIAYQLARSIPEFMLPLQAVVDRDPLLVGRAMHVQFQRLLVEPFEGMSQSQFLPVIVIDGLDECADHKVQQQILRLLIGAIRDDQLPLRLLITSRPEPHIREVLETGETLAFCRQVELSADQAAYDDVRTYLRDEFARIHSDYRSRGIDLGADWPSAGALELLVKKSSGIFIYAATVIRFIDDEYSHPGDRLESALKLDPKSTAPLDDLYTQILSVVPQEPSQLRVLHAVWTITLSPSLIMDAEEVDMLLTLRRGTCRLALRGLHALFDLPPVRTRFGSRSSITVLHASVADYFLDPRRSGSWSLSLPWLRSDYLHCMIRLLSSPRTDSNWFLHRDVLRALPTRLADAAPTEDLIQLLRNQDFQDSIFLVTSDRIWPQRDSMYPRDLIQLWEDHQFISRLTFSLKPSQDRSSPTFQFDSIYCDLLSRHPVTLFVVKTQIVAPNDLPTVLRFLGPGYTYRVFQPFLEFRDLELPFPAGDSPADFLSDPLRAMELYSSPEDIAEALVLLGIRRTKQVLSGGEFWLSSHLLSNLEKCPTSSHILRELETLDLSELCNQLSSDPAAHAKYSAVKSPYQFLRVLTWLRRISDPPLQTIAFWEGQLTKIRKCSHCGRRSNPRRQAEEKGR
ncbi:hypothetical protein DFH09DRAFT_1284421 [Mycena vulgaris]|nr:hypothetical protein DFH09DRAFT_1284421 [Mycena vulgaris]